LVGRDRTNWWSRDQSVELRPIGGGITNRLVEIGPAGGALTGGWSFDQ
jgi:hypothetical protein